MDLAEALSGRAGIEGVQWVLFGRPSRLALRRSLDGLLSGAGLRSCHLKRAKFKPGRSLTSFFDVRLIRTGTNSTNSQEGVSSGALKLDRPIQVVWKPGGVDAWPEVDSGVSELETEAGRRGLLSPFLKLSARSPEWGMRIQVFPLDVDFPKLVRLADPVYAGELLKPYWPTTSSEPGQDQVAKISITPIRYRPGQRHVLRYERGTLSGEGGAIFAKIYNSDQRAQETFQAADWASDWFAGRVEGVSSVKPMAYLPEDGVVLYPQVEGVPLSHLLSQPGRDVSHFLGLAGSALRSLHGANGINAEDLKPRNLEDEISTITRAGVHLQALLPETHRDILDALHFASDLHEHLPQEPPTFGHSDFKSDHLMAGPAGLTIIDFDTSSLTDPAFDVGKFLADLDWWHALYQRPCLQDAHAQFLSSYSQGVSEARLARARLYEGLVLMRIAVRRVPLFSNHWEDLTKQLIGQAVELLRSL